MKFKPDKKEHIPREDTKEEMELKLDALRKKYNSLYDLTVANTEQPMKFFEFIYSPPDNIRILRKEMKGLRMKLYKFLKPTSEPIPGYCNLYPIDVWKEMVDDDGFIDYDGWGKYSDGEAVFDITVYPSDYKEFPELILDYSHIAWFNK